MQATISDFDSIECRLAASNLLNCISHALFASAVARSLASVIDTNAMRLLVGDDASEESMPLALRFEDLAKQLMRVLPFLHFISCSRGRFFYLLP